jgi:hypothetical protein
MMPQCTVHCVWRPAHTSGRVHARSTAVPWARGTASAEAMAQEEGKGLKRLYKTEALWANGSDPQLRCGIRELNATLLKQADDCNTTKSEQKALQ